MLWWSPEFPMRGSTGVQRSVCCSCKCVQWPNSTYPSYYIDHICPLLQLQSFSLDAYNFLRNAVVIPRVSNKKWRNAVVCVLQLRVEETCWSSSAEIRVHSSGFRSHSSDARGADLCMRKSCTNTGTWWNVQTQTSTASWYHQYKIRESKHTVHIQHFNKIIWMKGLWNVSGISSVFTQRGVNYIFMWK